jgi:2-polyprenyl-3-methyl-5-hydroxy-6-metoxy-1,4-benzoquinol methylase
MEDTELKQNIDAWMEDTYSAWVERFGKPLDVADKIRSNPMKMTGSLFQYFGEVNGKQIVNIMGSYGIKAVALAVLGGEVTVIDISESNGKYALELAEAAGTKINYVVKNILDMERDPQYRGVFDIVFAEMGILHYFTDLNPFFRIVRGFLGKNGKLVVKDFHPVSTKLIKYRGSTAKVRKYKVDGDYFSKEYERCRVSYSKHKGNESETGREVLLRNWTIGEIVTAVATAGMRISQLKEEANESSEVYDKGIPKTFTLEAYNE